MHWNDDEFEQRLREFRPRKPGLPAELRISASRGRRWVWAAAAAVLVSGILSTLAFLNLKHDDIYAVVEAADGNLYRVGDRIGEGKPILTSDKGSMFALADGSRVEMRAQSEFTLERASDGVRLRLSRGVILVSAAKQHGHLYVQTKDVTVSVVGTVFLVNAEEEGSRVAVIEGEVRVKQGEAEKKLLPGEQVASNPSMPATAVKEEIAWSRNLEAHLALLAQAVGPLTTAAAPPQTAPATPPQTNNGSIEGIVVLSGSSQPVADAEVFLVADGQRGLAVAPENLATMTQPNGRFRIENVKPGGYRLQIRKLGYFSTTQSATRYLLTAAVAVAPQQQITNLEFQMIQGGVIKGRVLDENKQPLSGVPISALLRSFDLGGNPRISALNMSVISTGGNPDPRAPAPATDDKGEYRLFWLPPGQYYVRAEYSPQRPAPGPVNPLLRAPAQQSIQTYYPSVNDLAQAAAILITSGAEITADINLRRPDAVTIKGRLVELPPAPSTPSRNYTLYLLPRDRAALTERSPRAVGTVMIRANSDGQFTIPFVTPGDYLLVARYLTNGYAQIPIEVRQSDIDGVLLEVPPNAHVKFQVTVEGNASDVKLDAITAIGLKPELFDTPWATTRVSADGSGEISTPPGRYVFQALQLPGDAYIADVRQDGRSVLKEMLTIGSEPAPLQVTIGSSGGRIEGTVVDTNRKPIPALVTVAPVVPDRLPQTTVNLRTTAESNGRFSIGSLPPGDYRVFAWEDIPTGGELNPAIATTFGALGTKVTVAAGSRQTIELRRIARDATSR